MHRTNRFTLACVASLGAALCSFLAVSRLQAQEGDGVFLQRFGDSGEKVGGETAVGMGGQGAETPAVAALSGNAGFVVAWDAVTSEEAGEDVLLQRFAVDGTPVGSAFAVNSYTTGSQLRPAVAAAADGGFLVAWDSANQDGDSRGVFAQRFDNTGAPVGSELQVNLETASAQRRPAIARTAAGDFIVVWESVDQDGSGQGVFGRRFDSDGTPANDELAVNTYTEADQNRPTITADADGGFVVAWESVGQDDYGRGVFAQRFDASAAARGLEFRINTYPVGGQRRPALAALADGGFVAAWDSNGQDGSGRGVFVQRFDAAGAFDSSEQPVNTHTANHQQFARVAGTADGGFLVAWESFGQDGNSYGIYAQRFDAQGKRSGGEVRVPTGSDGQERAVDVTGTADGGFVTVWERQGYCPGDCNGNGQVAIGELIQGVGVALGQIGVDNCRDADANGDERVSIGELTRAVRSALNGC